MDTLPGLENAGQTRPFPGNFGQGLTESETRAAIAEIEDERPLVGILRTLKQAAIALAMSIDNGNNKGRSVANDVAQLVAIMQQLAPPEDVGGTPDDSHLTPETRRLLDALAAPAELDAAPEGNAA